MSRNQVKSQLTDNHAQRLEEWNKRMTKLTENTAKLGEFLRPSDFIVHLSKKSKNLEDYGFEADNSPDEDYEMRDSVTNGNMPYCKLLKFKYISPRSRNGTVTAVLGRQYWFYPTMSASMKWAIGEGARLQSYFTRSRTKEAPYFLDLYGVFYDSPQDGQKLLYVMHELLPPSSLAHKLWNFEVLPNQAAEWTLELARAAEWLNLAGVAHRFIRPENVLLVDDKHIRLAGFDVACSYFKIECFKEGELPVGKNNLQEQLGLPDEIPRQLWDHLPPECLVPMYDAQLVDSWSIGVLLCTLLTTSHPFDINQPATMLQQWKQSTERAAVPFVVADDPLRTLLDDIFQPMDNRITTFDLIRDKRLKSPASSRSRGKQSTYYRIDKHSQKPPPGSGIAPKSGSLDASKFSELSLQMYNQDSSQFLENIPSEEAIRHRINGTKYQVLRNASFGGQFDVFRNENFLAAESIDEKGQPQNISFLVKIFLLQYMPKGYRSMLLVESSKIIRFLSAHNTITTLLRVVDIFVTKLPTQKMFIFYANELMESKSLRQLTAERSFRELALLDYVMHQLAVTVEALTRHGVTHRYLRPEHIFLTNKRIIKVTCLEMMCFSWNPKEQTQVFRSKGLHDDQEQNWTHLPPECFLDRYDSLLLDVWSFGVVLVYCLTQQIPFNVPHTMEEATDAWNRFKSRDEHAPLLAPYMDHLKRIFQPAERRLRSSELVEVYRNKLNRSGSRGGRRSGNSLRPSHSNSKNK